MTLEEAIKRYKKHSECIQQTLITKEEAMNVYEWLRELKTLRAEQKDVYMNGYNEGYEDGYCYALEDSH